MSDIVIIVISVCVTTLGLTTIMSISTYKKDKLEFKTKTSIKDIINNEIAITGEDKKN
ncbi:hypothetical protein ACFIJ5_18690 (plasmid) [Haloimpatiens sp. FM7330]|uniref:hypothetical protein n=1 Tax=Haloimpatiens sp. FM7330 TaxID=3298610 RepID=UPI003627D7B1